MSSGLWRGEIIHHHQGKYHRIQVRYTPTHPSWLNQIELWFSILVRRVRKRGNFPSRDALRERILAFIASCNQTAHPFRWAYRGIPHCR